MITTEEEASLFRIAKLKGKDEGGRMRDETKAVSSKNHIAN